MSATFTIQIDTTAPAVSTVINAGAPATDQSLVDLETTSDPDAYEMKVWGAIDPTDPINASYGETEEEADWIAFSVSVPVRLAPGGGAKRLYTKVRDDVNNVSAVASDDIPYFADPSEAGGMPVAPQPLPPATPRKGKTVRTRTSIRPRVAYRQAAITRVAGPPAAYGTRSRQAATTVSTSRAALQSQTLRRANGRRLTAEIQALAAGGVVERVAEGPETEAELAALGIL